MAVVSVSVSCKNETHRIRWLSPSGKMLFKASRATPPGSSELQPPGSGSYSRKSSSLSKTGRVAPTSGRLWVQGMEGDPVDPLAELSFVSQ